MRNNVNRKWVLNARPKGAALEPDTFRWDEEPIPEVGEGEFLVRNLLISFDPAQRGWINDVPSYVPPVQIGEAMRAGAVGQVIESRNSNFQVGDLVNGTFGWQEFAVSTGEGIMAARKLPPGTSPEAALSVLGGTGMTAYFGMQDIGRPGAGDTVVISGAAGATGSVAGQVARLMGASRVIGIAGGAEKCRWLTQEAKFDAAIDYKNEDVGARLGALAPEGINVYFDNVGGPILDQCLARIAFRARVVLCGGISSGYGLDRGPGPSNYFQLVIRSAKMEGFIVLNYVQQFSEATKVMQSWIDAGELKWRVDVARGLENAPKTLAGLFAGANFGKQLLKVSDPSAA
ncbi:MAG TPA: NADP-dependent oxidoreductase [Caulobacteraceae bacterium]|nr:NADP-dependent oxidoreductase [Caulobacteraceae bacterium]